VFFLGPERKKRRQGDGVYRRSTCACGEAGLAIWGESLSLKGGRERALEAKSLKGGEKHLESGGVASCEEEVIERGGLRKWGGGTFRDIPSPVK